MSISRKVQKSVLLLIATTLSVVSTALAQERFSADGIRVNKDTVVVFAKVQKCDQLANAQIFVSADRGKTWEKKGPAIEGSEFQYSLIAAGQLWVAGIRTAEGPSINPFVLVPTGRPFNWNLRTIYKGPSELKSIALRRNGQLTATVRHINVHDENWNGPLFIHKSSNRGSRWTAVQQSSNKGRDAGQSFREIRKEDGSWRIVDSESGGFRVQHRQAEGGPWSTTAEFSSQPCN